MFIEPERATFILNLLKGSEADKESAIKVLHGDISKSLYRRFRAIEKCSHERTEEIVQETFLKIFRTSALPEEPKALLVWILTIAQNVFRDQLRKDQRAQDALVKKAKEDMNIKIKAAETAYKTALSQDNSNIIRTTEMTLINLQHQADILRLGSGTFAFDEFIHDYQDQMGNLYGVTKEEQENPNADEIKDCIENAIEKLKAISPERASVIQLQLQQISILDISTIINRTEQATRQFLSESRKALRKYAEPCKEWLQIN